MRRREFIAFAGAVPLAAGAAANPSRKPVALVLGGGGCRGYGHIGVIRALEKAGLRPDMVVGASVGALVGVLYAAGFGAAQLERLSEGLGRNTLRNWILPKLGLFGGEPIARFVRKHLGERSFASLPTRFAAVATDLRTGNAVVIDRGELGVAVQASASVPGWLEPVQRDGRPLVDGCLSSPVPVAAARQLGAGSIVAVDVTLPPQDADLRGPYDALYQSFSILTHRLALSEREGADVLVAPKLQKYSELSAETVEGLIAAGERAASSAMDAIRAAFARAWAYRAVLPPAK
jgi:NTE family protein